MSESGFSAAVFDIETSALDAVGAGVVLCAVIKPLGEKPIVLRYDKMHLSPGQDKLLVRNILNRLCSYDMLIGHNIVNFDWNFLKTRALRWDIPITSHPYGYDTLKAFKRCGYLTVQNRIGKPSAGLDMVVDMYGIPQKKTKLYPRQHWQTIWGERKQRRESMDALVEHCIYDVEMNEQIYKRLFRSDAHCTLKRLT